VIDDTHYLLCESVSLGIQATPWWFS